MESPVALRVLSVVWSVTSRFELASRSPPTVVNPTVVRSLAITPPDRVAIPVALRVSSSE